MKFIIRVILFSTALLILQPGVVFAAYGKCSDAVPKGETPGVVDPYYTNIQSTELNVTACFLRGDSSVRNRRITTHDYDLAFAKLVQMFSDYGIAFSQADTFELVIPSEVYEAKEQEIAAYLDTFTTDSASMTIYFTSPYLAERAGWSFWIPGKRMLVGGSGVMGAIAHEMGHSCGLLHTFGPIGVSLDYPGSGACDVLGDRVCDTPPSFYLGSEIADGIDCDYTAAFDTANSNSPYDWTPIATNQMEYTSDSCRQYFTDEQVFRMLATIEKSGLLEATNPDSTSWKSQPAIDLLAKYPIAANNQDTTTVFAVGVSHPNGYLDMRVVLDASLLAGRELKIDLFDNGVFPDLVDNDGIYTSTPQIVDIPASTANEVTVFAGAHYEDGGNHSYAIERVRVIAIAIAQSAEYPIVAESADTSSVVAVRVAPVDSLLSTEITIDASSLGGPANAVLSDDGVGPDLEAKDGLFTSDLLGIKVSSGSFSINFAANFAYLGEGAGDLSGAVQIVAEDTGLKFVDGSSDTGDLFNTMQGNPFANTYFETQIESIASELLVLAKDGNLYAPEVFRRTNVVNGSPAMENMTQEWFGLVGVPAGGRGVCSADYDNDGDMDLFVCNNGASTRLYQNSGSGYSDVTSAAFGGSVSALNGSHVAAWGDYNQDGWVDLFVAAMAYTGAMCDIGRSPPIPSPNWSLFKNTGEGFELTSGLLNAVPTQNAISATWNDIDNDGDLDLLVGYVDGSSENNPRIFVNQGYKKLSEDYVLADSSSTKGIANLSINSMDWFDYNHDAYPDLVVTPFDSTQSVRILVNVSDTAGQRFEIAATLTEGGRWEGATIGDLDFNGEEDIVLLPHTGIPEVLMATPGVSASTYNDKAFTLGLKPTGGATPAFTSSGIAADSTMTTTWISILAGPGLTSFCTET